MGCREADVVELGEDEGYILVHSDRTGSLVFKVNVKVKQVRLMFTGGEGREKRH